MMLDPETVRTFARWLRRHVNLRPSDANGWSPQGGSAKGLRRLKQDPFQFHAKGLLNLGELSC